MQDRTALLIGQAGVERLAACRVAVVGLGGVGGHCAEALARAGVGALHLVDGDVVTESNLNRQLVATFDTIGRKKTDAMAERLAAVSRCRVTAADVFVLPDTVEQALPGAFDFLVDAIDTLAGKLALVDFCRARGVPMVSCMGAGNPVGRLPLCRAGRVCHFRLPACAADARGAAQARRARPCRSSVPTSRRMPRRGRRPSAASRRLRPPRG